MGSQRILPPGFVSPCIPTLAVKPPAGPGWVHEIKHDGYRLIVRRKNGILKTFYRP
jgi:bifunctional non-homologous end joining protein LigD